MFLNKTRVLLVLPEEVLGRARVFAGTATATLRLPVSLQIVLRALIEEGLKRDDGRALLANVESQAQAVRRLRSRPRRGGEMDDGRNGSTVQSPAGATRPRAASAGRGSRERPGDGMSGCG